MIARGKPTAKLCTTYNGNKYFEIYRYDAKGRINYQLSAYGTNWIKVLQTSYNFVGDVVSSEERVYTHEEWRKVLLAKRMINNTYHPGTRLLASATVTHVDKNKNTSTQTISNPTYDDFGNIIANNRPGTAADMTYEYDALHGWVRGISSPSGFSEQLLRETATNAQLSGNIGSMEWRNTSKGEVHKYDYTYDDLGRLTNSQYSSSANDTDDRYNEIVAYNSNGSITSLLRRGMMNNGTFGEIDDLSISYNGNQLMKVTDAAEAVNYNGALDFHDGADAECEYRYDSNGALKSDSNRGIASITYDYGHHPNYVRMTNRKNTVSNDYTPDGIKLSSKHASTDASTNVRVSTTDQYVDGLILRDGKPLMWQFDGGYVELDDNGTPTSWNYYVTDHLGSTRKVVDSNNNILETINYYPFGSEMKMKEPGVIIRPRAMMASAGREIGAKDSLQYGPVYGEIGEKPIQKENDFWQPYRFSGKELDKQNGLNMYDFGARLFDVAGVPMWTSIDPLAEKYYNVTPYSYCAGNPVSLIDPDGRKWEDPEEAEKLKGNINSRITQLENANKEIDEKINTGDLSEKTLARLSSSRDENNEMISNLKKSASDIDLLGKDSNTYAFRHKDGGEHHVVKEDNVIYIESSSNAFSIHEVTHVSQSLANGGLKFDNSGTLLNAGGTVRQKAFNEIEAYKRQYSYDQNSFPGSVNSISNINIKSVGNITNSSGQYVYPYINKLHRDIIKQNKINKKLGFL